MKNIANYVSISRAIMSIILAITETFSVLFYIIYIYCGLSDILDGFIARKSKTTSEKGTRLDSLADMVFVIVVMIKIIPRLNISTPIFIWLIVIILIKICNIICSYIYYKKIIFPHTIANKVAGIVLFIIPFIITNINIDLVILEVILCIITTFSAIQEGHYIRTRKRYDK